MRNNKSGNMNNSMFYGSSIIYSVLIAIFLSSFASANTGNTLSGSTTPQAIVTFTGNNITIVPTLRKKFVAKPRPVTLGKFFVDVCTRLGDGMPTVYKDITITWPNIAKGTTIYTALQKCAYLGIIEQKGKVTNFQVPVKGNFVYDFLGQKLNMNVPVQLEPEESVPSDVWESDIHYRIPTYYAIKKLLQLSAFGSNGTYESPLINSPLFSTFSQVYSQIQQNYHYLSGDVTDDNLMYGAIKGIVDSLHDQYSIYFPPEQAADFYNSIQGEYYGVGMYVEIRDGKFSISSTITGSPAQAAGLQPGDIVLSVDDWIVPDVFTVNQVVSRIKGPIDTSVTLKIRRGTSEFSVDVQRKKIVIPMMKTEKKGKSMVFSINSFGQGLTYMFNEDIQKNKDDIINADKIIIDLRNNPGGYVEEAAGILSYFVPKGEPVVYMEMKSDHESYDSQGYDGSMFSGKQIYVLINGGSASASEILAGTLKDYIPSLKIVGEKSYGKGSAQTVMGLPNGGTVKYTIALWYTGKTNKSIEKIGITPDILQKDDPKTAEDELLDKVLTW